MNTTSQAKEILINATRVSSDDFGETYEFVLDELLSVAECVRVESLADGIVFPVHNYAKTLRGTLFELNHVRVNPRLDNRFIIHQLTEALSAIGVRVSNPPAEDSIAMCFKPLGEISDNVRFYFDSDKQVVFLTPSVRLHVVNNQDNDSPQRFI